MRTDTVERRDKNLKRILKRRMRRERIWGLLIKSKRKKGNRKFNLNTKNCRKTNYINGNKKTKINKKGKKLPLHFVAKLPLQLVAALGCM